jgi:hypothetical protein
MKKYLVSILFVLIGIDARAQELPNLPPSIKWQQINSGHFKIIYEKELENEAQRTANILEHVYQPASQSLGVQPRVFPIILQNNHAVSNGFVTIAPYRSELFLFEPQNYLTNGNDRWLERLVTHEYRHMVQFEKALSPFNKVLYFFFGEPGAGAMAGLAAPAWFFEGDAVGMETSMGRTGRGRIPAFSMAFKANLIEKGGFNYYKQYLKSFRDFVPNHYLTGYLMTTYLKNNNGAEIWDKIMDRSFRAPYIPFTFSRALRIESGQNLVGTYNSMLDEQRELYQNQLSKIQLTPFELQKHNRNKRYTNYLYPKKVFGNKTLAIKNGFSFINQMVLIDEDGNEEKILELGSWVNPGFLSATDTEVVWVEQALDTRWQRVTYTVIKKLDLKTRKVSILSSESKYSGPSLSHDGKLIVAFHQSEFSEFGIHLLNAKTGAVIKEFENDLNCFYSMLSFDESGKNILMLKNEEEGKSILLKNIETEIETVLYFSDKENLGHPIIKNNWLYYASDLNGIDNIYAVNLDSDLRYQVTSSKFGAFSPFISEEGTLLYNDYTSDGHQIARNPTAYQSWLPVDSVVDVGFDFQDKMVESEDKQDILYNYPDSNFNATKYSKGQNIFRPYFWTLGIVPANNNYSILMQSKDLLATTQMSAGIIYNTNENVWRTVASVSYQGLYPIIDGAVGLGKRTTQVNFGDSTASYSWNEDNFSLGLRVPVYLTNSRWLRKANLGVSSVYSRVSNYDVPVDNIAKNGNGNLYALTYTASYIRALRRSKLDLNYKWGQTLALTFKQTPFGGNYFSTLFAAQSNFYFPGLFRHQSLHFRASYQWEDKDNYAFSSPISFTRGFGYRSYDQFVNIATNYKLPLAYMDWHIGPIINLQRIYANAFFDYGIGQEKDNPNQILKSVGAEVSVNFNFIRLLLLFDLGVRYTYLPDFNQSITELVIGGISF